MVPLTQASIFHLEPFPQFLQRVVELNRLYSPDDPLHDAIFRARPNGDVRQTAAADDDAAVARKRLATIHRDFPFGAPVHEQAAYLVRAFTGLAPFAEANHRTGWDYTCELLMHHHLEPVPSQAEGRELGNELWDRMQAAYPQGFSRRNVLDRDDLLQWLADWFNHRIA